MRKHIIAISFLMFVFWSTFGGTLQQAQYDILGMYGAAGSAGFSCDCSGDVTFCWIPDDKDADCADGNATGTEATAGAATISYAANRVVFTDDSVGEPEVSFQVSSEDSANNTLMTIEFLVELPTSIDTQQAARIWQYYIDTSNQVYLEVDTDGNFTFTHEGNGENSGNGYSCTAGIAYVAGSTGEVSAKIRYDTSAHGSDYATFSIGGYSCTITDALTALTGSSGNIKHGNLTNSDTMSVNFGEIKLTNAWVAD